jgi:small subunit ribosomal protein S16
MLKKHLAGGVAKGALTEEEAEKKLEAWLKEKEAKIAAKTDSLSKAKADAKAKALEAEKAINEARTAIPPVSVEEEAEESVAETEVAEAKEEAAPEEAPSEDAKASNEEE